MNMFKLSCFVAAVLLYCNNSIAQSKPELKRKVRWAFSTDKVTEGFKIRTLETNATIHALGLKKGDIITSINGFSTKLNLSGYKNFLSSARADDSITIIYLRDGQEQIARGLAIGLGKKKNTEQITWHYDWVPVGNGKMRVIVQSPAQKTTSPAILYIPDFACMSTDYYTLFDNPHSRLLQQLASAGYTVVIIEKTEFGDNDNIKGCQEYDLVTETNLYRAGYNYMRSLPYADKENLFLLGNGMGSIIAATLANEIPPKGIISYGTHYRPWSDYWFERLRWHAYSSNKDLVLHEENAKQIKQVFNEFFVNKKSPDELIKNEAYKAILEKYFDYEPDNDGGIIMRRNWRYWQQVDTVNISGLWKNINCFLLLLYGENDTEAFEEKDQWMLADVVNTYNPGAAEYQKLDSVDHNYIKTSLRAFTKTPSRMNVALSNIVGNKATDWLSQQLSKKTYNRPLIILPKDTSLLNMRFLANSIVEKSGKTTIEKVQAVIKWANNNLTWTGTDYNKRTAKQVLCMREGNCNEEAIVVVALFKELGIQCRRVREINIQPVSERRQESAARLVANQGNSFSVFGLRHNDHVWIEFFNEETKEWLPADPTLGLVGIGQWISARVGFGERPVHHILSSRDMLVPVVVFAFDENMVNIVEDRTNYYLVKQFAAFYNNKFVKKPEWEKWVNTINALSPKCKGAMEGTINLHLYDAEIAAAEKIYKSLKTAYGN
jgi:uncharacterized protein